MNGFTAMDFLAVMAFAGAKAGDVALMVCRRQTVEILKRHGIPGKVPVAHSETLSARGYWDYGTSSLYGWVTEKGLAKLREMGRLESLNEEAGNET
jgi:hypothetical protein